MGGSKKKVFLESENEQIYNRTVSFAGAMDDRDKASINDNLLHLVSVTKWSPAFEASLGENLFKNKTAGILDKIRVGYKQKYLGARESRSMGR